MNKYFPPPRSIGITERRKGAWGEERREKNQLVESTARKKVAEVEGGRGTGLSSRMTNEACLQHFKGGGRKKAR